MSRNAVQRGSGFRRRLPWLLASGLAGSSFAPRAGAASHAAACSGEQPYVLLQTDSLTRASGLRTLERHLQLELGAHGMTVCSEPAATEPLARLRVDFEPGGGYQFRLSLEDAVTGKTVLRTIDLGSIPANGRPLALGIAADELLRASWAELGLREAPQVRRRVPNEVSRAASADREERSQRARSLGSTLGISGQVFAKRALLFGPDVGFTAALSERLLLRSRLGFRQAAPMTAPDGTITVSVLRADAALGVDLLRRRPWAVSALAGVDVWRAVVSGQASARATAHSDAAIGASGFAGVGLELRLSSRLRLALQLSVGHTLRGVHALDGSLRAGSLAGLYTALGNELEVSF